MKSATNITAARRPSPVPEDITALPVEAPKPLSLGDVNDVVRRHPAFTPPAVRMLIHRADHNGLHPHLYRIGRRVLIDLNGFEAWVRGKQRQSGAAL